MSVRLSVTALPLCASWVCLSLSLFLSLSVFACHSVFLSLPLFLSLDIYKSMVYVSHSILSLLLSGSVSYMSLLICNRFINLPLSFCLILWLSLSVFLNVFTSLL